MTASPPQIYARGRDSSAQELGNDIFTVSCTRISEMREDGVHAPTSGERPIAKMVATAVWSLCSLWSIHR